MRWKWITGIMVIVILVLILTGHVILLNYDFNDFKPKITEIIKKNTGREFTIAGDIDLKISLSPSLMVEGVSFQNAPWGSRPELARVKRLEVKAALIPLIRGDIEIKRLIVIEPDILIETDKSGKSNLEFKISEAADEKDPVQDDTTLPVFLFNEIEILKGLLTYKDGQSGQIINVELDSFFATAKKSENRIDLSLKGNYSGKTFEISGTTGRCAALADPKEEFLLELTAKTDVASITLEGTIRDVLHGKGLDLIITASGDSISDLAEFADITGLPDIGPFSAKYKVSDHEGRITFENIDVMAGSMDLAEINLKGSVKDPLKQQGLDLDLQIQGNDLANLQALTAESFPLKGPFKVNGRVSDPVPKRYKISNLIASLGENRLEGTLEMGLSGKRPKAKATLFSKKLDLRSLFENGKEKGNTKKAASKSKRSDKVFPNDPLPLDFLYLADARLKLQVQELLLPQLAFQNLKLNLNLKNGLLVINPLQAGMGGGVLDARLTLDKRKKVPFTEASIKIEDLDLKQMLKNLERDEMIEGILDLEVTLNSRGNTPALMMAGLSGKVFAVMGEGRIDNQYIGLLGADLNSGILRLVNPSKESTGFTKINCFVNRLDIKDGLAEVTALVMNTPLMTTAGEGQINLKTEKLDISLEPSPKKGVRGYNLSFGELVKPFRLSGTLANPSLSLDPTKASMVLGKAVGGVILFGPAGVLAAMAGKSSGDENPCLVAIEAAEKDVNTKGEKKPDQEKGIIGKVQNSVSETFKKIFN